MKKLVLLSAATFVFAAMPAHADHHGHSLKDKVFGNKDLNNDGVLSKDEFHKAQEEKFSKMDADGNGEISREEVKASRQEKREKMKAHREKVKDRIEERASSLNE